MSFKKFNLEGMVLCKNIKKRMNSAELKDVHLIQVSFFIIMLIYILSQIKIRIRYERHFLTQ